MVRHICEVRGMRVQMSWLRWCALQISPSGSGRGYVGIVEEIVRRDCSLWRGLWSASA